MFISRPSSEDGVDLVKEDNRWFPLRGHSEQGSHELLSFSKVLGHQRACTDIEEGSFDLPSQSFCNHSLPVARRTVHENSSGGFSNSSKELWIHHGKNDCILDSFFNVSLSFEIFEGDLAMFSWNDVALDLVEKFFRNRRWREDSRSLWNLRSWYLGFGTAVVRLGSGLRHCHRRKIQIRLLASVNLRIDLL